LDRGRPALNFRWSAPPQRGTLPSLGPGNWGVERMAETTAETNRNVGIGLIVGGLLLAGLLVVLIVVGWTSTPRNLILVVAASFGQLLAVYLIGYGIKKIAGSGSAT